MTHESTPAGRAPRRDTARTHALLLDTAGALLRERGTAFTLPDLARESGVSTATTYRHFEDVHAVFDAYYRRTIGDLVDLLATVGATPDPMESFEGICREWALGAVSWGRSATHIRSARGYLERVREREDPLLLNLYATLSTTVEALVKTGRIPPIDVEYAVLVWITMFDERVVVDLEGTLGWPAKTVAENLGRSVLAAWGRATH
jgi:AcrR family transcriptional regulator